MEGPADRKRPLGALVRRGRVVTWLHRRFGVGTEWIRDVKLTHGIETKTPRLLVVINAKVGHLLDLTSPAIRRKLGITLAELAGEDWRKLLQSGQESLSQALGRAAASTGASGLLVRSAFVRNAHNLVIFPLVGSSGRLTIVESEALARLTQPEKA